MKIIAIRENEHTNLKCDECGKETDWVLQVGTKPNTACLCKTCTRKVSDEIRYTLINEFPCIEYA